MSCKKEYECPKAEKLEFDYTHTVLASGQNHGQGCDGTDKSNASQCTSYETKNNANQHCG